LISAASFLLPKAPVNSNLVQNDLLKEIWIAQLMEKLYANYAHLTRSIDMTAEVDNNIIHLADAGIDPEVLIDNNAYPIPMEERSDNPLELPLSRFRTKNTVVRDAEARQLAYNKMESVIRGHRNKLGEKCAQQATYAWTPQQNDAFNPVFASTGADRADGTSRKRLLLSDIVKMQEAFDLLKVPEAGRILVLSPQHKSDILNADAVLFKAFSNLKTGEVMPLYGFDVYVSQLNPTFKYATGQKNAFDSAVDPDNDSACSLFYHESEVMRADGTVDMFSRLRDPEADGDIVGFSKRFIGLPMRSKYRGAIFSDHS
jgi:hypothetical protein